RGCTTRRGQCVLHLTASPVGGAVRAPRNSHELSRTRVCRGRRADELRTEPDRCVSPRRRRCRSDSQGRGGRRPASRTAHQVRASDQSRNRNSTGDCYSQRDAIARRRGDRVNRRDFITLIGGAATAWPLAARAQQPAMPVIGMLAPVPQNEELLRGFRQGLKQTGFVEGENLSILYHFAENEIDRLPALADD